MLDPADWASFRSFAHRVLDDSLTALETVGDGPAWRAVPPDVKRALAQTVPRTPTPIASVYQEFATMIAPYSTGNRHPRFLGWVHGTGTPSGVLSEMLAATLNANVGGREQSAVYVERAVIAWSAEIFGFPPESSGILTSGTSLANLIAVLVARRARIGESVRTEGLQGRRLVGYASDAVHRCVPDAFDIVGLGSAALRRIPTDEHFRIEIEPLRAAIARDREAGHEPFMIVATAGTVDTGAIDDVTALADLCAAEGLWLHVDGAFGALAILSPAQRASLRGIERADSVAFDFHKWLHVPYDAGCILLRDAAMHLATFQSEAAYLAHAESGTAGGAPWFADYGPELSRRFRALAIWFAFKEFGTAKLGAAIAENCAQAARIAARIAAAPDLILAAPVALNIVCFRFTDPAATDDILDAVNAAIVVELQERGVAVPSATVVRGRRVIRLSLTNQRVTDGDLEQVVGAAAQSGHLIFKRTIGESAHA